MPRGYLKHQHRTVGAKRARGGSSRNPGHVYKWICASSSRNKLALIREEDFFDKYQHDTKCSSLRLCRSYDEIIEVTGTEPMCESFELADSRETDHGTEAGFETVDEPNEDYSFCEETNRSDFSIVEWQSCNGLSSGIISIDDETVDSTEEIHLDPNLAIVGINTDNASYKPQSFSEWPSTIDDKVCGICLDGNKQPLTALMKNCRSHPPACHDCLRELYLVNAQSNLENYPLKCFWPNCNRILRDTQIRSLALDEREMQHYYANCIKSQDARRRISAHKQRVECSCGGWAKPWYCVDKDEFRVLCPNCHLKYWVKRIPKSEGKQLTNMLLALGMATTVARCPECRAFISKEVGCDDVKCVCGNQFLYTKNLVVRHS